MRHTHKVLSGSLSALRHIFTKRHDMRQVRQLSSPLWSKVALRSLLAAVAEPKDRVWNIKKMVEIRVGPQTPLSGNK